MNTNFTIRPATKEDIPVIANILSDAAAYKFKQGDSLWGSQPYSNEDVSEILANGGLHVAIRDNVIVGSLILADRDKRIWQDDGNDNFVYIHQLATSSKTRGQDIGGLIIKWVEVKAKKDGKKAVRLDCSYTNLKLHNYYIRKGFKEVKRRDLPRKSTARDLSEPIYKAALMQKDLI
jgi:ribosomal protein S18 acetylase RimI-like enzyme